MVNWSVFAREAPRIAEVFVRRLGATGNLCMLATIRADGSPRISPMEPRVFEDHLLMVGMPNTLKYRDLARDPRFCVHTATVDPHVSDGDAKLSESVVNLPDKGFHKRFVVDLFEQTGFDLRALEFDPFYVADLTGASSVALEDKQMKVTIWKPGEGERSVPLA